MLRNNFQSLTLSCTEVGGAIVATYQPSGSTQKLTLVLNRDQNGTIAMSKITGLSNPDRVTSLASRIAQRKDGGYNEIAVYIVNATGHILNGLNKNEKFSSNRRSFIIPRSYALEEENKMIVKKTPNAQIFEEIGVFLNNDLQGKPDYTYNPQGLDYNEETLILMKTKTHEIIGVHRNGKTSQEELAELLKKYKVMPVTNA